MKPKRTSKRSANSQPPPLVPPLKPKAAAAPTPDVAPCHFCSKSVRYHDHFCHGCNHVVCDECSVNYDLPFGGHNVGDHRDEPERFTW